MPWPLKNKGSSLASVVWSWTFNIHGTFPLNKMFFIVGKVLQIIKMSFALRKNCYFRYCLLKGSFWNLKCFFHTLKNKDSLLASVVPGRTLNIHEPLGFHWRFFIVEKGYFRELKCSSHTNEMVILRTVHWKVLCGTKMVLLWHCCKNTYLEPWYSKSTLQLETNWDSHSVSSQTCPGK